MHLLSLLLPFRTKQAKSYTPDKLERLKRLARLFEINDAKLSAYYCVVKTNEGLYFRLDTLESFVLFREELSGKFKFSGIRLYTPVNIVSAALYDDENEVVTIVSLDNKLVNPIDQYHLQINIKFNI